MMESGYLPDGARHFEKMPNSARVDIAVVCAMTGRSRATIYRWIDAGTFPKPTKIGGFGQNQWKVGDIRAALNAAKESKGRPVKKNSTSSSASVSTQLTSAAPELLEALQALVNQFHQRGVFVDPEHPDRIALALAESAIAKATGGE